MPSHESPRATKLGLGTVQFGLDYGISNTGGQTPPAEVDRILALAKAAGVSVLDTAPGYGDSERVLGGLAEGFRVVTKTKVGEPGHPLTPEILSACLRESLARLRLSGIHGLLFHRVSDLLGRGGVALMAEAIGCRERGLVRKVGVSVYSAEEIDTVLERFRIDLIQVPVNVFDQRLLRSGRLRDLRNAGVEVHVRSVFLQGLLLMEPKSLPPALHAARAPLAAFRAQAGRRGLTPLQAALGFALGLPEVDTVLCGVNTEAHLRELLAASAPGPAGEFGEFALEDTMILDPKRWAEAG